MGNEGVFIFFSFHLLLANRQHAGARDPRDTRDEGGSM